MLAPLPGKGNGADQGMGFDREKSFRKRGCMRVVGGWRESQAGGFAGLGIPTNRRGLAKTVPQRPASQSVVLGPKTSASPRTLLEMQNLGPQLNPTNALLHFNKPLG